MNIGLLIKGCRRMKRHFVLVLTIFLAIFPTACSNQEKAVQGRVKPVKAVEVKEEAKPEVLSYVGTVSSSELKKLAFKSTGKIGKINFEKGQWIKAGDVLVELENQDLQYALNASKGQVEAARSIYEKALNGAEAEDLKNAELNAKKAQDAFDFVVSNYKKAEALYNSGAISKLELDKAKLEMDIKDSELNQSKELLNQVKKGTREEDKKALFNQLEQAQADYDYKASLVQDAAMKADGDGYVVNIMYKKGELVPAGYPVAVVRNENLVANVGLAEKDIGKVMLGTTAKISVDDKIVGGTVTNISQVPDVQTRTYNIEITLEENSFNIGAVAKVDVITDNERGIWIPLTSMLSDGMDYVYLAKDNIAEKREIVIEGITGSMAKVKGLTPGEQLVIEGMKRLRAGDGISVLK